MASNKNKKNTKKANNKKKKNSNVNAAKKSNVIRETKKVEPEKEKKLEELVEPKKDKRTFSSFFYFSFLIIYLEILTKIFIIKSFNGIFYTLLFSIPLIILLYLISNIFREKGNKVLTYIITIIFSVFYGFHFFFHRLFSNIFSFNTLGLASNVMDFTDIVKDILLDNIGMVFLYLVPLILLIVLRKRINFKRTSKKCLLINLGSMILIYVLALLSILINKTPIYSAYNLYYNTNNEFKMMEKFGIFTYTRIDIKRVVFGFDEKLTVIPTNEPEVPVDPEIPVSYNKLDIDFDSLINNESNKTIKNILTYFKESNATKQNEYTGMFKDKNLIFILAEGFNMIAVDKELTPTLYKLTHEGFVFNNFYSPVFLSTTGGEFQATTGLIPTQEALANWKRNKPIISYALGNALVNMGYEAQSYHNWTYNYYSRDRTMPTLGFNDYTGCWNGMEKMISCRWLPSDVDMINTTLPLYKDKERFVTYYVSVSGHAEYNFFGNSIAIKNKSLVQNLPYSTPVKAYLATQIEFDRALEALIKGLEEQGILEDTVIAFAGDHYPYTLSMDEVNEISTYKRDAIVEVNRSNLVIWNNTIKEPIIVEKTGSQIDILPTLLNLFGVEYDSRLIMGKDILSDTPGMAIFSNRSWVSDYGTYNSGRFTLKEGKTLENQKEYIDTMNKIVADRFTLSNQIIKYNMYQYILK